MHSKNQHRERYDFQALTTSCPDLSPFVAVNKYGDESINFFNPEAVKMLNKALLKHHYQIEHWDIPKNYLCPPIPGRADYIHYIADLLTAANHGKTPKYQNIKGLDIGVGANCVYPIIGCQTYQWSFIGSDIDAVAVKNAKKIVIENPMLNNKIEVRLQSNPKLIFQNIIQPKEHIDFTICNPPFHASAKEAQAGSRRKVNNLKGKKGSKKTGKPVLNFGGKNNELWCEGGEKKFIQNMIYESKAFANNCFWFTTLVSKASHLDGFHKALAKVNPTITKTIAMTQGNKISRFIAWTFLTKKQQKLWRTARW